MGTTTVFACPTCGSDRHSRWTWRTGTILHWMINPGLIINEILLGQRVPATIAFCESCDLPRVQRQYVQCTSCAKWHPGGLWSGQLSFGNWFGLVCPACGANIPSFRNVFALLITILTAPIWWPASWILRKRHRDWNRRRFASALGVPSQASATEIRTWILLGAFAWGPLTWALFSVVVAGLAGLLAESSLRTVLVGCLLSLPLWLVAGTFWGYLMSRWSGATAKTQ